MVRIKDKKQPGGPKGPYKTNAAVRKYNRERQRRYRAKKKREARKKKR